VGGPCRSLYFSLNPTEAEGQWSKTAGWRIVETRGSRVQLGGVTGNRSSALCLPGRERISIVLLSFGGASWMVSGSVRGGENRDIPEGAAPAAAGAEAARQAPCPAWAEPD